MKKQIVMGLLAVLAVLVFAGCKGKDDTYEPAVSGIYVREDGSVVSADIEDFGESYYDKAELQSFVEDGVIAYNKSKASLSYAYAEEAKEADKDNVLPVSILSLKTEGGKARLLLEFASAEDYLAFNGEMNAVLTELSQKSVGEAIESGASFAGLKDKDGNAAEESAAQKKKKYSYLTVTVAEGREGGLPIQVQGTIQYVSGSAEITGTNTVKVPAGESAVIIYK
jgi:hypothetical protein